MGAPCQRLSEINGGNAVTADIAGHCATGLRAERKYLHNRALQFVDLTSDSSADG